MSAQHFDKLIKHHKVVSINNKHDSDALQHDYNPLPHGLEEHDVYLVHHKVEEVHEKKVSTEAIEEQVLMNIARHS